MSNHLNIMPFFVLPNTTFAGHFEGRLAEFNLVKMENGSVFSMRRDRRGCWVDPRPVAVGFCPAPGNPHLLIRFGGVEMNFPLTPETFEEWKTANKVWRQNPWGLDPEEEKKANPTSYMTPEQIQEIVRDMPISRRAVDRFVKNGEENLLREIAYSPLFLKSRSREAVLNALRKEARKRFDAREAERDLRNTKTLKKSVGGTMTPFQAYEKARIEGPSDTTRVIACEDAYYAYAYARSVDCGPRDDTRAGACKSAECAWLYAREIDKGPRDDTRKAAQLDPDFGRWYKADFRSMVE